MQIPAAYAATLAHVRSVFPGALIAGGCLRDLDNGRPVKDVDVFAPSCSADYYEVERLAASLGEIKVRMGSYGDWSTPECVAVFDIAGPELDYQIICLTSPPHTILGRMDFGLCRISYDGESVYRAPQYLEDQRNAQFTLVRCDNRDQLERSLKRHKRLGEKYIGWPLNNPEGLPLQTDFLDLI